MTDTYPHPINSLQNVMKIQWFPGHMHKAGKEIAQKLPEMDLLIEVLDARLPFSSVNPMIAGMRHHRQDRSGQTMPTIRLFNKSDLADPVRSEEWQAYFEREKGVKTLAVSRDQPERIQQLTALARKLVPRSEHRVREIHAMIVGIPNVGKSSIINTLTGRGIAKTGNEAAVTRHLQRIKLSDDVVLFDTPGLLWGNIENEHSGYRLAISGAIKDTAFNHEDIAFYLAEFLLGHYPRLIQERYQLEQLPQTELELIESIGRLRGCLRPGGQVQLDKACKILVNEFRLGTLGAITLETPQMIELEVEQARCEREQRQRDKQARKAERKKRWKKNRK